MGYTRDIEDVKTQFATELADYQQLKTDQYTSTDDRKLQEISILQNVYYYCFIFFEGT